MSEILVGYARCAADDHDPAIQRERLAELGVNPERIYLDQGLTGTGRSRPGLLQALAAVREGDTLVVMGLARLAWSVADARALGERLAAGGVKLSLGGQVYDPDEPVGAMFFTSLAVIACFDAELRGLRAREGMAGAKAGGRLRGKPPTLSVKQRTELRRMHDTGDYSVGDLAEIFSVSRPTVYRNLQRTSIPGQAR